jgi:hypothetical protein
MRNIPRRSGAATDIGAYEAQKNDVVFNTSFEGCPSQRAQVMERGGVRPSCPQKTDPPLFSSGTLIPFRIACNVIIICDVFR